MTAATVWSAGASLSLNTIVASTTGANGMFFRVTQAGTTGSSEPEWAKSVGVTVYDNNVRYVSFSSTFEEISKINPSAIIELYELQLVNAIHGSNQIYRFHNGSSLDANGQITWKGNAYLRFPIEAEGFAFQRGQLPRPTLTISNLNSAPNISAILLTVNQTTTGNDLTGAKFVRIRTLAKYIDAINFANNTNATADPNAEFPREIYFIDRKTNENREVVSWELSAVFDLMGIRAPKRQCTRRLFPAVGTFKQ